ncbi:hypothetical protein [Aurantimonas sp. HBX-1]|uniref:hypothetical protein n=1 Tax=Aurantimonas sp. HBX-1 TaxID=2906072 RepID=UPI001F42C115|nr:hypothetical protein [Aurantimonas sp. HBX-1]UIJ70828.1 hypothetical protein LXB15_13910 [Aurantimonas sp. HBX-1]
MVAGGTDALLVLSYNVCWEAMSHRDSLPLGRLCTFVPGAPHLTRCAVNVSQCIDAMPDALGMDGFDFIGLQEASNWYEWRAYAPRTLLRMAAVHSESRHELMVSYYDDGRYDLSHEPVCGNVGGGRPFQILVCAARQGGGGVIFINIHAGHHQDFGFLAGALGAAAAPLPLTAAEKAYRIIVVGDFNEADWNWHARRLNVTSWQPLAAAGIAAAVQVGTTPFTCCKSDGNWQAPGGGLATGDRAGDYVFDSVAPTACQIPPNYLPGSLQSDHLPVLAVLPGA